MLGRQSAGHDLRNADGGTKVTTPNSKLLSVRETDMEVPVFPADEPEMVICVT